MPQLFGLARIGRDAELRFTTANDPVAGVSLAFSYGKKDADGKRSTEWVDASLWGARAEALAPYLLKGTAVSVTIDDVHIETYEGRNGPGSKLVGRISSLEFAGGPPQQDRQEAAPQRSAPRPSTPRQAQQGGSRPGPAPTSAPNFADMDDDIPF